MTEKHDTETAREALSRLVDAAYGRGQRTCFSIPPNEKRDADLILEAIITERDALRAELDATARVVDLAALVAAEPGPHDTSAVRVGACVLAHGLSDGDARACAAELRAELAAALAPTARVVAAHERIALAVAEWLDADDCRARLDMPPRPIDQSDDERQDAEDRVRTAREDVRAALAALDARDGAR